MDPEDEDDLEDDLPHDGLSEVEGPVHHHGAELDQNHDQEGTGDLVLRQRRRNVRRRMFLKTRKRMLKVNLMCLHKSDTLKFTVLKEKHFFSKENKRQFNF